MWWSNKTPPTPPKVPSDTVLPLHRQDDSPLLRSIVLCIMMKFDAVLDPGELRTSLEKLLSQDGWNKFGGRLRLNDTGRLEYHIPVEFTEQRPSVRFTRIACEIGIDEHQLASQLPRVSAEPSVSSSPPNFQSLMAPPDGPKTLQDYLGGDEPQLGTHVFSFLDATLVTVRWPHTLTDASGLHALLNAWSLVLQGRDGEVPLVHGIDSDPVAPLGTKPTEPYLLADKYLTGWQMFWFGLCHAWENLWYSEESRTICLPAAYLRAVRQDAIDQLSESTEGKRNFLSEGDVICAWWARYGILHLASNPDRTVLLGNALDLRAVMVPDLLPADKVYLGNGVSRVTAFLPVRDILSKPLWYVASVVRQSVAELGARPQIEALEAMQKVAVATTGRRHIFGDASMHMMLFTNWTKAKFFETDFSAAVRKQPPGFPPLYRLDKPGVPSLFKAAATIKASA